MAILMLLPAVTLETALHLTAFGIETAEGRVFSRRKARNFIITFSTIHGDFTNIYIEQNTLFLAPEQMTYTYILVYQLL